MCLILLNHKVIRPTSLPQGVLSENQRLSFSDYDEYRSPSRPRRPFCPRRHSPRRRLSCSDDDPSPDDAHPFATCYIAEIAKKQNKNKTSEGSGSGLTLTLTPTYCTALRTRYVVCICYLPNDIAALTYVPSPLPLPPLFLPKKTFLKMPASKLLATHTFPRFRRQRPYPYHGSPSRSPALCVLLFLRFWGVDPCTLLLWVSR